MEAFIKATQDLKSCFDKSSYEDSYNLNSSQMQKQCIDEKVRLAEIVFGDKILAHNVIDERIEILKQKKMDSVNQRKRFIENSL